MNILIVLTVSIVQFVLCWYMMRNLIVMDALSDSDISCGTFLVILSITPFVGLLVLLCFILLFVSECSKQIDFSNKFFMINKK